MFFVAVGDEIEGSFKTFNICYATTKDMALSFARRRLWAEPTITKHEKEKFYDTRVREPTASAVG